MSLTNPNKIVTEERLSEFYGQILPYLGGMPDIVASKFDRSDIYSTSERMVGQWIDGKPLYQKTIQSTLPNVSVNGTSVTKDVSLGVSIDSVVNISGVFRASNAWQSMTFVVEDEYNSKTGVIKAAIRDNAAESPKNILRLSSNLTSFNGNTCYVTLRYTKTTDSAVAIGNDTDYSTTEKIIGTWIDGKPLYQKTFDMGTLTNASTKTTKSVAHNISNIEKFINTTGVWYRTNGVTSGTVPYNEDNFSISAYGTDQNISIRYVGDFSNASVKITAQYTKTTE